MTLAGKRLLITGVLTRRSIAFAVAREAQLAGAEVVLTGFGRSRRMTERAAAKLPEIPDVLELDVNSESDLTGLADELRGRWDRLDGALHAIAFAPEDAIGGRFLQTPPESAVEAFRTSAYSYAALGRHLAPLMEEGGSLVGLDFDASVPWPSYDWMGVSKAALEAINRYLARELGPLRIRANLVSAGPISSPAASGISGFEQLARGWDDAAPLGWDTSDPSPVAGAVCFLFSDASRAISGELIHVDGGAHAVSPARSEDPSANGARAPRSATAS
jgi:enoyl-[acyl-carrier protein] reductase I